jgi:hypothetical protein
MTLNYNVLHISNSERFGIMTFAPRNTYSVASKNSFIEGELIKYGELKDSRSKFAHGIFTKPKSIETRANEAQTRRYECRSNICSTCHMTIPLGTKECENCE